jgi:hypothetical protein
MSAPLGDQSRRFQQIGRGQPSIDLRHLATARLRGDRESYSRTPTTWRLLTSATPTSRHIKKRMERVDGGRLAVFGSATGSPESKPHTGN